MNTEGTDLLRVSPRTFRRTMVRTVAEPSLYLDFTASNQLDSRITFTRASSATFFDSAGVLQTAASGAARFTYDPATLQPQGLLIEEQRTNSIRNNTMQGAVAGTPGTAPTNWSVAPVPTGVTREIVAIGIEDGITYVDIRFSGTSTQGSTQFPGIFFETTSGISASTGQVWAGSVFFSLVAGTGISFAFSLHELDSSGVFLRSTTLSNVGVPTSGSLRTRRFLGAATTGASTAFVRTVLACTINDGQTVDFTLRIGLPQLELGAFATSVIPTTTTALTRNADVASMTGTNFSSWFNAAEGTVVWDTQTAQGANAYSWSLFGSDTFNRIFANYNTLARITSGVRVGGTFLADPTTSNNSAPTNTFGKGATAYKADDFGFSWNGNAALTDTSLTLPTVQKLDIGSNGAVAGNFLNGTIRRLAFYPQRLSNAQLVALTG